MSIAPSSKSHKTRIMVQVSNSWPRAGQWEVSVSMCVSKRMVRGMEKENLNLPWVCMLPWEMIAMGLVAQRIPYVTTVSRAIPFI